MTSHEDDGDQSVGYKRPPRHTRWQKGQSGGGRKKRAEPAETEAHMIERLLTTRRRFEAQDGCTKVMTVVEGIVLVLVSQAMKGSVPAYRVLQRYRTYQWQVADRAVDIEFADT